MLLNVSFTLEPRTINGLQVPIDKQCTAKIRTAFNDRIVEYRSKFYVSATFTCPAGVQLKSPELTFQEPVMLCLSGEPFHDEGGMLSCLVAQGNLSHITRKSVFEDLDQVRLKPACSATEAS